MGGKTQSELAEEGKVLKALLPVLKRRPHNFAFVVGKEDTAFGAHPKRSPQQLRDIAKKAVGGSVNAFGTARAIDKTLILKLEKKPPGGLAKLVRKHFKDRGVGCKVVLETPDGVVEEDGADTEPVLPAADSPAENTRARLQLRKRLDDLTPELRRKTPQMTPAQRKVRGTLLDAFAEAYKGRDSRMAGRALDRLETLLGMVLPPPPQPSREGRVDYVWTEGPNGEPVLETAHDDVPPCRWDAGTGKFVYRLNRGWKDPETGEQHYNWYANNPEPNARYEYENGWAYETDQHGNTTHVEAMIDPDPEAWDRDPKTQAEIGRIGKRAVKGETFDGGHLIPRELGGAPGRLNVVPMQSYLNQHGAWREAERNWKRLIDSGISVKLKIEVFYPAEGSQDEKATPQYFRLTQTVGGKTTVRKIKNTRTGR